MDVFGSKSYFYNSVKVCGAFLCIQSLSESEALLNCRLQVCVQALKRNGRFLTPKMEDGALITLTLNQSINKLGKKKKNVVMRHQHARAL